MSDINISAGISGQYRMVVTKPDGSVSQDTGWFDNLITDIGMDRLGNTGQNAIFSYCRVGSGTTPPAVTDTQLVAPVGSASNSCGAAVSWGNEGAPLYRTTLTHACGFPQGAVVGNISEVGIGWGTTGATLFSRALILDDTGNPITITLVPIDQLTVYYRVRIVPPLTDTTGLVTINNIDYNYTGRVSSVASFGLIQYLFTWDYFSTTYGSSTYKAGSDLGAITGYPTGSQEGNSGTYGNGGYTNGSYYRDSNWNWSVTQGNATGGIQVIRFIWGGYGCFCFQIKFDKPIPKTNTNTLSLTMRFSWARA